MEGQIPLMLQMSSADPWSYAFFFHFKGPMCTTFGPMCIMYNNPSILKFLTLAM